MKILLINNGGFARIDNKVYVETGTGNFAKELQSEGNSVTIFQIATNSSDSSSISRFSPEDNNIGAIAIKPQRIKLLTYILGYIKLLFCIMKCDFVYVFYPCNFKFAVIIAKLFGKKSGLYIRGMNGIYSRTSRLLYKLTDTVLTVSDSYTQYVNQTSSSNKAHTIRPMLKFSLQDIVTNRTYINENKTFNILFLGRMDVAKGIVELINAISILRDKDYKLHCEFVGSGDDIDLFKSLVRELELTQIISFPGTEVDAHKIREYYTKADCYVLPTYHEGFPRTLYEAMIFGTPIITTFVGAIPGLMVDNYNCKKIDVRSVDSIVSTLSNLFDNYETESKCITTNATKTISDILSTRTLSHAQQLAKIIKYTNQK